MNILEKANQIVNERSEEKERMYGNFDQSMEKMRDLFNAMTNGNATTEDMYLAMVAMKLARESHAHKEDNLLDAVAYLGALNNYKNNQAAKVENTQQTICVNKSTLEKPKKHQVFVAPEGLIEITTENGNDIAHFKYNDGINQVNERGLKFTSKFKNLFTGKYYMVSCGTVFFKISKDEYSAVLRRAI